MPSSITGPDWPLALFRLSVVKQEKLRRIEELLGDPSGATCLDIGGDNGVVSLLLRRKGGTWHSADLDEATVDSIRTLVGERVHRLDGGRTPFADHTFDLIVIVDFLEHIHTDAAFIREVERILRPGGVLIINVPRLAPGMLLNRIRPRIGLTDAKHGHVRPGYTVEGLRRLLGPAFSVESARHYSKTFTEALDTVLNAALELTRAGKGEGNGTGAPARKGQVFTADDWKKHRSKLFLLRVLHPLMWLTSRLDVLLPDRFGYKLILRARRGSTTEPAPAADPSASARHG